MDIKTLYNRQLVEHYKKLGYISPNSDLVDIYGGIGGDQEYTPYQIYSGHNNKLNS